MTPCPMTCSSCRLCCEILAPKLLFSTTRTNSSGNMNPVPYCWRMNSIRTFKQGTLSIMDYCRRLEMMDTSSSSAILSGIDN